MGRIPYTQRRHGGTYVLRKRISFANSPSNPITWSLGTKNPCLARTRAAAACAALDRVVAVINRSISLYGGARPASQLAELARRALNAQLGFALKDQLDGPDPDASEAALVFGDYYALAARQGDAIILDDVEHARLLAAGRTDTHMRKLALLIRHNTGSLVLSDQHLKLHVEAFGMDFRADQAASDRRVVLNAWADAQHKAAKFQTGAIQASPCAVQHLLDGERFERSATSSAREERRSSSKSDTREPGTHCASQAKPAPPLLSEVAPQIIAGIVSQGKWKQGPGGTAEDAERLIGEVVWIVGDLPVDQYEQGHIAIFEREKMKMPKSVKAKTVWDKPFNEAKISFPRLTTDNTRNSRTMNKDLSYLSTFAERMVSEGYWAAGKVQPLTLSHKVTKKQKDRAKSPWGVAHIHQMMASPIFHGNAGPKRRLKEGPFIFQDAAYWLLPLAIYTAGCQEELGGLLLDEVILPKDGVPHLIFQDNRLRTLKREARERVVPIHPQLIALGFDRYVDALRREGATELFPELWINEVKRGGDQYRSIVWNKLTAWLRAQGTQIPVGIAGKAADFHSLRSSVLSLLDRADINQNIVADIAGHARKGVTASTYQDLVATGGLEDALSERMIVLKRLPDFTAGVKSHAPRLLPLNLRSR